MLNFQDYRRGTVNVAFGGLLVLPMFTWDDVREEFEVDGSLRDIYVLNSSLDDWRRFVDLVRSGRWAFHYSDGEPLPDPSEIFPWQEESMPGLLSIFVGSSQLNVHFFCEDEIELDFDPGALSSADDLQAVLDFMHAVADTLGKPCILTPENCPDSVVFRVVPGLAQAQYCESGGSR